MKRNSKSKRASLVLLAAAGALVWSALSVISPYVISHPPGPQNPSLSWYLLYHLLPPVIVIALIVMLRSAWTLWRQGKIDLLLGHSLERSQAMRALGVKNGAARYAAFFTIVGAASAVAVIVAFVGLLAVLAVVAAIRG